MNPETMKDLVTYAESLSNEEISKLITEFYKIQNTRADEKLRATANKVVEAITEYLKLGEEISVCGTVYNEKGDVIEEVEATLEACANDNGYLTFRVF